MQRYSHFRYRFPIFSFFPFPCCGAYKKIAAETANLAITVAFLVHKDIETQSFIVIGYYSTSAY